MRPPTLIELLKTTDAFWTIMPANSLVFHGLSNRFGIDEIVLIRFNGPQFCGDTTLAIDMSRRVIAVP